MTYDRVNTIAAEVVDATIEALHCDVSSDLRYEAIERVADRLREEIEAIKHEAANERVEGID